MSELHDRVLAWLADGASAPLSRDAALHASACPVCLDAIDAYDALLAVDVERAGEPMALATSRAVTPPASRAAWRTDAVLRVAGAVVGAGVLVVATVTALSALDIRLPGGLGADPSPTPVSEGVLSGAGGLAVSAPPTPSPSPTPTDTPSPSPTPVVTPPPTPVPTPVPTPAPTPVPTPAPTPVPTPPPTPTPVPTPTPAPSEQPSPSASADGTPDPSEGP